MILVISNNNGKVMEFVLKANQLYQSIGLHNFSLKKYMLLVA